VGAQIRAARKICWFYANTAIHASQFHGRERAFLTPATFPWQEAGTLREGIGVYVHFPFCLQKCPYCDFVSFAAKPEEVDHEGYADAVLAELDARAAALAGRELATVFFGGGTPSLWSPRALGRVLEGILRAATARAPDVEITAECNPSSLDEDRARALVDVGVNRLSVGVQGLDARRLAHLGRLHDPEGGLAAVEAAIRAGAPRVSADLIYGVAVPEGGDASAPPRGRAERPDEARAEALRVAATGVTHVSAYALTIEPATAFGELARKKRLPIADEDLVAETFAAVEEALEGAGFGHYEVSNYARPGDEARHNLGYWRGWDYLGLGCAAFGTLRRGARGEALRYRNTTSPRRYVEAARAREPVTESEEALDAETRLRERIMLGLRLAEGLDLEAAAAELGCDPWPPERRREAERLRAKGLLVLDGGRVRVPRGAWVLADGIAAALF
jgi:oxygen-independent coproporphyrinogen-3 oxidase